MSRLSRPFEAWWYQLHYSHYEQYSSTVHGIRQIPWFVWDHDNGIMGSGSTLRQYIGYCTLGSWDYMGYFLDPSLHPPDDLVEIPRSMEFVYTLSEDRQSREFVWGKEICSLDDMWCIIMTASTNVSLITSPEVFWRRMAFWSFSSLTV